MDYSNLKIKDSYLKIEPIRLRNGDYLYPKQFYTLRRGKYWNGDGAYQPGENGYSILSVTAAAVLPSIYAGTTLAVRFELPIFRDIFPPGTEGVYFPTLELLSLSGLAEIRPTAGSAGNVASDYEIYVSQLYFGDTPEGFVDMHLREWYPPNFANGPNTGTSFLLNDGLTHKSAFHDQGAFNIDLTDNAGHGLLIKANTLYVWTRLVVANNGLANASSTAALRGLKISYRWRLVHQKKWCSEFQN